MSATLTLQMYTKTNVSRDACVLAYMNSCLCRDIWQARAHLWPDRT